MISVKHINTINRAIDKVHADGFTTDKGYALTVGLNDIIVVYRDRIDGDGVITTFDYDEWKYKG